MSSDHTSESTSARNRAMGASTTSTSRRALDLAITSYNAFAGVAGRLIGINCLRVVFDGSAKYCYLQGTSMASPHVTGVVVLIESLGITNPGLQLLVRPCAGACPRGRELVILGGRARSSIGMRLARRIFGVSFCAALLWASACGQSQSATEPPACATTFARAITSSDPTPGVWDCLTPAYQSRLQGEGDGVFAVDVPLWSHYRYIGLDRNIALFELTVNDHVDANVYDPPVTHVIIAVYLDRSGRVDHAKAATPAS